MMKIQWVKVILLLLLALVVGGQAFASQPPTGILALEAVWDGDTISAAGSLCDQDVETAPQMVPGKVGYIYLDLPAGSLLSVVKLYMVDIATGYVGLEYLSATNVWQSVAELNNLEFAQLEEGWNRFALGNELALEHLRLRVERNQDTTGIGEVELWGRSGETTPVQVREYVALESEILEFHGGKSEHGTPEAKSVTVQILDSLSGVQRAELVYDIYDLETYAEGVWQINGSGKHFLTPPGALKTWTTAVEAIHPELLVRGDNQITFEIADTKKNGFQIANVCIRLYYDHGERTIAQVWGNGLQEELLGNVIDGDEETYWESGWQVRYDAVLTLVLDELTAVEYVGWMQGREFVDVVQVEYRTPAGWKLFAAEREEEELLEGWNWVPANQCVVTDQIRLTLENPHGKQMIGPIREVAVWGSKLAARSLNPEVMISYPRSQDEVKIMSLVKGFVRGQYDTVMINGETVSVEAGYFEQEVKLEKQTQAEDFQREILVEALQGGVPVGSDRVNVVLSPLPEIVITSPANGYSTAASEIWLEGETDSPANQLYINGIWFATGSQSFGVDYPLDEGINQLTLKAVSPQGLQRTAQVLVRKDTQAPLLHLAQDYSKVVISEEVDAFILEGFIEDYSPCRIYLNGVEAVLQNGSFAHPVPVVPGYNDVLIRVQDQHGYETTMQVCLVQDSTPPAPFTPVAHPAEWSQETRPVISFATTDGQSGMSHYEVSVDGGAYIWAESPYKLAALTDGEHTVTVKAVDRVGLARVETVQVYVDTTPPAPFTPTAVPASWTNDTQPVISFATTDNSAIDHYEVQINGGGFSRVTSPYRLPQLTDGVHVVGIKAVDLVGLATIGTVEVFIDTLPPVVPANFEVNPGDQEIVVKWLANAETDVVEYRLYREPVWSAGPVQVVEPYQDTELEYVDQEVENGSSYTYYVVAVDHAANLSVATGQITKEAGIAVVEVDPAEGGEIEYGQDVAITIPAEALTEEGTVQVNLVEEEEIPAAPKAVVSKTFQFEILNEAGEVEPANFAKEVTIEIGYDETMIPEGFSEYDLNVYYFNELDGLWVILPRVEVDTFANKVIFTSTHFSMYNVQLTENYSPSAADYADLGIAPYASYFKNNQEYISPASATMNIRAIDVSLPGRNGMNLMVSRSYSSQQAVIDKLAPTNDSRDFGPGWRLNLARFEDNDQGQYLYLEDGTAIKCEWIEGEKVDGIRENTFEHHEGTHFKAVKRQEKKLLGWKTLGYNVYFADGTHYVFDDGGRLKSMTDRTGNNVISFTYDGGLLQSITDSIGRLVTFHRDNDDRVTSILVDGYGFAFYSYNQGRLQSVKDARLRTTSYHYTEYSFFRGGEREGTMYYQYDIDELGGGEYEFYENNIREYKAPVISQILYPTGAVSQYSYTVKSITQDTEINRRGREQTLDGYWYSYRTEGTATTRSDYRLQVNNHYQLLAANASAQQNCVDYTYEYVAKDNNPFDRISKATATQPFSRTEMEFDEDGLTVEKRVYDLKLPLTTNAQDAFNLRETYAFNENKAVTEEAVYHGGQTVASYTQKYEYDGWGNLTRLENSVTGTVTYNRYLNSDQGAIVQTGHLTYANRSQGDVNPNVKNLLAEQFVANLDAVHQITTYQQVYNFYDNSGNLRYVVKRHGDSWVETQYEYDVNGNVVKVTTPDNGVTLMEYDPEDQAFLVKVTQNPGNHADGSAQAAIIAQYGYDPLLGVKTWEIDPLGALTEYSYDLLGRVKCIRYPDANDLLAVNRPLGSRDVSDYDQTSRLDNPLKVQVYDDTRNVTTVANLVLNMNMFNEPRDIGYATAGGLLGNVQDVLTEGGNIHNMSRYQYDSLGKLVELRQYLRASELHTVDGALQTSPFVTRFAYDEVGNRVQERDAEGMVTFREYDGLNRLTRIYYPDGNVDDVAYAVDDLHVEIQYDPLANTRTIIDAEGNKTVEIKDWAGNVREVIKYEDSYNALGAYSSKAAYDQMGNQVQVIDGKGQRYDFYYDDWGQLIEQKLPETDVYLPGNTGLTAGHRPTVRYEYDQMGRKVTEISANGVATGGIANDFRLDHFYDKAGRLMQTTANANSAWRTRYYYDAAGQMVKTVDAGGNVTQKAYHPRGWVLAEVDPLNRIVYHQYDLIGKEVATTDPRGVVEVATGYQAQNGEEVVSMLGKTYKLVSLYTARTEYDSLSRPVKSADLAGNTAEIRYDRVGNQRLVIQQPNANEVGAATRYTRYTYTPQYWVKSVTSSDQEAGGALTYTIEYEYDGVGNKVAEHYPPVQGAGENTYRYDYDGMGRLRKVTRPDGTSEEYGYDAIGNRVSMTNGRGYTTTYSYNGLNKLEWVQEPTGAYTYYWYDPDGNLVRKQTANGLVTTYRYNSRNLLEEEMKTRAGDVMRRTMAYDLVGNLVASADARGNVTALSYYQDGQIHEQVHYRAADWVTASPVLTAFSTTQATLPAGYAEEERITYTYDPASGLLARVDDGLGSVSYTYTLLNQVATETREIADGATTHSYTTAYQYDFAGNLQKMRYPGSADWIVYEYNALNQLKSVQGVYGTGAGQTTQQLLKNVLYDPAGNLTQLGYGNDTLTTITPEAMSRPERIQVAKGQSVLLDLNYRYDANGNVEQRNNNIYTYDELDRLDTAEFDGSFLVDAPAQVGYAEQDYFTNLALDYALPDVEVRFDYAASTLGLKFGSTQQVGRIELIPGAIVNSRVGKEGIRLFYRATANGNFTEILPAQWQFQKDVLTGKLILTLKQTINAVEMKIHANYDDRNVEGVTVDESTVKNTLKEIVRVYGRQSRTKIAYEYDAAGNRMSEMYTDFGSNSTVEYDYSYYGGSDRLLTRSSVGVDGYVGNSGNYLDGIYRFGAGDQMGYTYDRAGNLTEKGNRYALVGDSLTFTAEAGTGVHYWKYDYNAWNRLSTVWRNDGDVPVARYGYDFSGKRLVVEEDGKRMHYVYNYLGQLLYEDHVTDGQQVSYVYAFGRVLVKVAGKVEVDAELSYYHHDSLGSTMLMTNGAGLQVFKQDYAPFGQTLYEPGTMEAPVQAVQPGFKYTGQREDAGTGLYYYNARYYDPETGRFTREDEYQGELGRPQTLNLYVYVANNPLKYIDPTGYSSELNLDMQLNIDTGQPGPSMFELEADLAYYKLGIYAINPLDWSKLNLGSKGSEVKELQRVLTYLGYKTSIDGDYGKGTLANVKAFQSANGLSPDGIIGKDGRLAFANALGYTETIMELVEVNVDVQSNNLYPLMQPVAAEAFGKFLSEVRADETIPEFSFGEVFRPRKKQAHFRGIYDAEDTVDLDNHGIKGKVNFPGRSFHEVGLAFDANVAKLSSEEQTSVEKIANKYGFYRTVPGEAWHFGYVGPNPPEGLVLKEANLRSYIAELLGYYSWESIYGQGQFLFQQSRYDDYVCPFGNTNYGN